MPVIAGTDRTEVWKEHRSTIHMPACRFSRPDVGPTFGFLGKLSARQRVSLPDCLQLQVTVHLPCSTSTKNSALSFQISLAGVGCRTAGATMHIDELSTVFSSCGASISGSNRCHWLMNRYRASNTTKRWLGACNGRRARRIGTTFEGCSVTARLGLPNCCN
jgi:hypothetical protein